MSDDSKHRVSGNSTHVVMIASHRNVAVHTPAITPLRRRNKGEHSKRIMHEVSRKDSHHDELDMYWHMHWCGSSYTCKACAKHERGGDEEKRRCRQIIAGHIQSCGQASTRFPVHPGQLREHWDRARSDSIQVHGRPCTNGTPSPLHTQACNSSCRNCSVLASEAVGPGGFGDPVPYPTIATPWSRSLGVFLHSLST